MLLRFFLLSKSWSLISNLANLGQGKDNADNLGLCYYCSLTREQQLELHNLIKGDEESILRRAMISKAVQTSRYFMSYEDTEVFCSISVSKPAAYSSLQLWCYSTLFNDFMTYSPLYCI